MKKIILPALFTFAIIASLCINRNENEKSAFSLDNIKMLQASAVETVECDASNNNPCEIAGVGKGTGALKSVKY